MAKKTQDPFAGYDMEEREQERRELIQKYLLLFLRWACLLQYFRHPASCYPGSKGLFLNMEKLYLPALFFAAIK